MDIERVNENTLKLFITYSDIETRGYSREEIWYNRSKGEELFWDIIGEVNTEDYFDVNGPIWIHINASETGLEIVVTRASFKNDTDMSSMTGSFSELNQMEDPLDLMDDEMFPPLPKELLEEVLVQDARYRFKDIDELIPLAKRAAPLGIKSALYKFEQYYYLYTDFADYENIEEAKDIMALCKEYLSPSNVTIHRLLEYGEVIIEEECFETIMAHFA